MGLERDEGLELFWSCSIQNREYIVVLYYTSMGVRKIWFLLESESHCIIGVCVCVF